MNRLSADHLTEIGEAERIAAPIAVAPIKTNLRIAVSLLRGASNTGNTRQNVDGELNSSEARYANSLAQ